MLPAFVLKQLYQPLLLDHQCKCQQSKKERWSVGVLIKIPLVWDIPGGPVVESPPSNAGDLGPIPAQETEIPHDRDCWSHYGKWRAQLCNKRSLHTATREAPMCLNEDPAQPKIIIKNKHKIKTQSYWKKKIVLVFWISSVRLSVSPKTQITPWQPGLWTNILPLFLYLHPSCLDKGKLCWRQRPP